MFFMLSIQNENILFINKITMLNRKALKKSKEIAQPEKYLAILVK